jgi:general secretion pathway protein M
MRGAQLRAGWQRLAPREKALVAAATAIVVLTLLWLVAIRPALGVLRSAEEQHRALDTQLQQMAALQEQARALQAQPKIGHDEAMRLLEGSLRERLGTTAQLTISGERATITLTGATADGLARWLTQSRVDARALPSEARLQRNAAGVWEGTLVLSLPPR